MVDGAPKFGLICWTCLGRVQSAIPHDFGYSALWTAFSTIHAYNIQQKKLPEEERALISHVYIADFTPFVPELTPSALKELSCQIGLAVRSWVNSLFEIVAVATEEDAMTRHKKITEPQVISKKSIQSTIQGYIYFLSGDIRQRGLCSVQELEVLMEWITENGPHVKAAAQALASLVQNPDKPFTLTRAIITEKILSSKHCLAMLLDLAEKGDIQLHHEIPRTEIEIGKEIIGQGTAGVVKKGKYDHVQVAVKMFPDHAEKTKKEFGREASLLSLLHHPNILACYGASTDLKDLFIVTELMVASLWEVLKEESIKINEVLKLEMAVAIAQGMRYLHQFLLVHRDLKSLNILVGKNFEIKICDFGLGRFVSQSTMTNNIGTVCWVAPEIFALKNYNEKADVYSFGIVLWEIVTRLQPFADVNSFAVPMLVTRGERPAIPKSTKPELKKMMTKCWQKRPIQRPSFEEIVPILKRLTLEQSSSNNKRYSSREKEIHVLQKEKSGLKMVLEVASDSAGTPGSGLTESSSSGPGRGTTTLNEFLGLSGSLESIPQTPGVQINEPPFKPQMNESNISLTSSTESISKRDSSPDISPSGYERTSPHRSKSKKDRRSLQDSGSSGSTKSSHTRISLGKPPDQESWRKKSNSNPVVSFVIPEVPIDEISSRSFRGVSPTGSPRSPRDLPSPTSSRSKSSVSSDYLETASSRETIEPSTMVRKKSIDLAHPSSFFESFRERKTILEDSSTMDSDGTGDSTSSVDREAKSRFSSLEAKKTTPSDLFSLRQFYGRRNSSPKERDTRPSGRDSPILDRDKTSGDGGMTAPTGSSSGRKRDSTEIDKKRTERFEKTKKSDSEEKNTKHGGTERKVSSRGDSEKDRSPQPSHHRERDHV